jgi:hypothetical protein
MKEREVRDSTYREVLSSFDMAILHGKRSRRRQRPRRGNAQSKNYREKRMREKIIEQGLPLSLALF